MNFYTDELIRAEPQIENWKMNDNARRAHMSSSRNYYAGGTNKLTRLHRHILS